MRRADLQLPPRLAFPIVLAIFAAVVLLISWTILAKDPGPYISPDCDAQIESAHDILSRGCLDWDNAIGTIVTVSVYALILLGLAAMIVAAIRCMATPR